MNGQKDTYKEVHEYKYPNMTVRVLIPDISDEENSRRMKRVYEAAADLIKSTMKKGKSMATDQKPGNTVV